VNTEAGAALRGEPCALAGLVTLDSVWLDDRMRCRWALRGIELTLTPGTLVALVAGADDGGPDAVLDLVSGRRIPDRGVVRIDGVDLRHLDRAAHRRATVELEVQPGGERRLCLPQATMLAARPSPATLAGADVVVVLEDGLVRP
jgi:ABC-type bacteriocin/lantibiotic exporter with double-glycine peptidase domain